MWLALLGMACDGGGAATPDAPFVPPTCAASPSDLTSCGGPLCGNGAIDECYDQTYDHAQRCSIYARSSEPCDGTLVVTTCEQYGYYGGGPGSCTSLCDFDPRACTACATDARVQECLALPGIVTSIAAADPSTPGVPTLALATNGGLEIVSLEAQGLQHVAMGGLPKAVQGIGGVPGGWLVAFVPTTTPPPPENTLWLRRYALDGTGVTLAPVPGYGGRVSFAHGPSNLTLMALSRGNNASEIWSPILDSTTDMVVSHTLLGLIGSGLWWARAVSDGTSFFVYTPNGVLFRIGTNGLVSSQTTVPIGMHDNALTLDGTTGWAVGQTDSKTASAQRFDTTGATVGDPISIAVDTSSYLSSFIADGNDLLYVRSTPVNADVFAHWLVRVDATGAIVNEVEVGRGVITRSQPPTVDGPIPRVVATRVGASIAIAWDTSNYSHQLALVTP